MTRFFKKRNMHTPSQTIANEFLAIAQKHKQSGDTHTALQYVHKSIFQNLECGTSYEILADIYIAQNEYKKAKKALQQALKINKDSENALYLMGFVLSLEELWEESVMYLAEADKKTPHIPEIIRCLGWSYYHKGEEEKGIALLERAKNMNPIDSNILCDLGVCYMENDEFEKAENIFKTIIQNDKESYQAQECLKILEQMKQSFL